MADNNYNGKIGDVDTVNNDWMLRIISKGLIHLMTIYLVIFWFSRLGNLWRCNPTIEVAVEILFLLFIVIIVLLLLPWGNPKGMSIGQQIIAHKFVRRFMRRK